MPRKQLIADPTYFKKEPIDVILGTQEYSNILLQGFEKRRRDYNSPKHRARMDPSRLLFQWNRRRNKGSKHDYLVI